MVNTRRQLAAEQQQQPNGLPRGGANPPRHVPRPVPRLQGGQRDQRQQRHEVQQDLQVTPPPLIPNVNGLSPTEIFIAMADQGEAILALPEFAKAELASHLVAQGRIAIRGQGRMILFKFGLDPLCLRVFGLDRQGIIGDESKRQIVQATFALSCPFFELHNTHARSFPKGTPRTLAAVLIRKQVRLVVGNIADRGIFSDQHATQLIQDFLQALNQLDENAAKRSSTFWNDLMSVGPFDGNPDRTAMAEWFKVTFEQKYNSLCQCHANVWDIAATITEERGAHAQTRWFFRLML